MDLVKKENQEQIKELKQDIINTRGAEFKELRKNEKFN